jgi:2-keto-4-pentenoate hydratase/2-oxohepta-3-ene-1,7-dioic acid hydratase in catechol pathway
VRICRLAEKRYGLVDGETIFDVSEIVAQHATPVDHGDAMIAALPRIVSNISATKSSLKTIGPVAGASFLSPVAQPGKLVAAPVNYEAHLAEAEADPQITFNQGVLRIEAAGLFLKATSSLVGPGQGVVLHFPDRRTDHEIELALVIGKEATNISEDDALSYVAGYAIGLDMSIRGKEDRSFRKSIDTYSVLGPWLVTADEFGSPDDVAFTLHVNDVKRQDSSTKRLIFGVRKLIAWASSWYTLHPGDVIYTGTPEGVGPVAPGDIMHCMMDKIGSMDVAVR